MNLESQLLKKHVQQLPQVAKEKGYTYVIQFITNGPDRIASG